MFLRCDAAGQCRALLEAARRELAIQQMGPPVDDEAIGHQNAARRVSSIGIASAYRTNSEEWTIWNIECFPKYYDRTCGARAKAAGGPHGDSAVEIMVRYFSTRKAPPGFSNHSDGRAVDFKTRQGGTTYTANTAQRAGWRTTWIHAWLVKRASKFRFHALDSEEWHWDYR